MPGICGFIGNKISSNRSRLLNSMCKGMRYINNDLIDNWTDGHLSIGRSHHGIINSEKQPLFSKDKSHIIFMDGEVFGYKKEKDSLIKESYQFNYDENDAEYCMHLYEQHGVDSFEKFNGSFLIAIYNLLSKELVLINDRFSSRPLFYYHLKDNLVFGPQLRIVLKYDKIPRIIDRQAVIEFFTFQKIFGCKTFLDGLKVLPPASVLRYCDGRLTINQYWEMGYPDVQKRSKIYYVEGLVDVLKQAVQRRTMGNHRYGILLSGGLDSRTILAASEVPMTAFTIADYENNEVKLARAIAEEKNSNHIFIKRDYNHYPNIIDEAVELGDGMYSFQHAHFLRLFDMIKKKCDILFYGCSLGTLFQGYYLPSKSFHIFGKKITLPILDIPSDRNLVEAILNKFPFSLWHKQPNLLFIKSFSGDFEQIIRESIKRELLISKGTTSHSANRADYFAFYFLSKHCTYLNELCIRPYMDERLIVFDNQLLDFYLNMPPELRFDQRIYRKAISQLNPRIGEIPNANTGLPPTISEYIEWVIKIANRTFNKIHPPKLPHPTFTQRSWPNMAELIRHNEKLKQRILNIIRDEDCISPTIFNKNFLLNLYSKHLSRQADYTEFLFLILTFGTWFRKNFSE